jgi:hypothetical protein
MLRPAAHDAGFTTGHGFLTQGASGRRAGRRGTSRGAGASCRRRKPPGRTSHAEAPLATAAIALAGLASLPAHATSQLAAAIGGRDPVACFASGKATPGAARHHHFWNGAVWFFESAENRDAFAAIPAASAPQDDGYCARAASQNYKRPGDPTVRQIRDGRLFPMVHEGARDNWRKDVPGHIVSGDGNRVQIAPYRAVSCREPVRPRPAG